MTERFARRCHKNDAVDREPGAADGPVRPGLGDVSLSYPRKERFLQQAFAHERQLWRWLMRLTRKQADADDYLYEIYLKLLALGSSADSEIQDVRLYVFQMAFNLVAERARRNRVVPIELIGDITELNIADGSPSVDDQVDAQREWKILCDRLCKLPTRWRQVFTLHKIYGYTHLEIARHLRISIRCVRKDLERVYSSLRSFNPKILTEIDPEK